MRAKVAERRSRINLTVLEDLHGEQFLKAIDIVLEAVSDHSNACRAGARWRQQNPANHAATNC